MNNDTSELKRQQQKADQQRYNHMRNAALTVLYECNIKTLPIDLVSIASHYGVAIHQNKNLSILNKGEEGASFYVDGGWAIVYDESQRKARTSFTLAHELAHILLGHEQFCSRKNAGQATRPAEEREADQFAARLLAPACVLWGTESYLDEDIQALCHVSQDFAKNRERSFTLLLRQNKLLKTELELEVYKNFLPFINQYNDKKIMPSL